MLTIPQVFSLAENAELAEGCNLKNFLQGGSTLSSNPLVIYVWPFMTEKVPLLYTFGWKLAQFFHSSLL